MKKSKLRITALLLAVIVSLVSVNLSFFAAETEPEKPSEQAQMHDFIKDCKAGDVIKFGSYPQTRVTDEELISEFTKVTDKKWVSYDYYSGDDAMNGGGMVSSDYMKYADFEYNYEHYRAVAFKNYRPIYTYESNDGNSVLTNQDDHGYTADGSGKAYYFKFEPLEWRVLDPSIGLVMSTKAIDAQAFNNFFIKGKDEAGKDACWKDKDKKINANDYQNSDLHTWLSDSFFANSFSTLEKSKINDTEMDYKVIDKDTKEETAATEKVFLLSENDVINDAYGFNKLGTEENSERTIPATDYAKCQGVRTEEEAQGASWMLRTASEYDSIASVSTSGIVSPGAKVYSTEYGIVPAMVIDPAKSLTRAEKGDIDRDGKVNSSDALLILQHAVESVLIKDEQLKLSADINDDKVINSSDALLVLQYAVGSNAGFGYFPVIDESEKPDTNKYKFDSKKKDEVLKYYQEISALEINANKAFSKSYSNVNYDSSDTFGSGLSKKLNAIIPEAVKNSASDNAPYPGKAADIKAEDWTSAEAVSDEKFTTVTVNVVPQNDDAKTGGEFEGSCGRSIGVIGNFEEMLNSIPKIKVDSVDARVKYLSPVIKIKVDNATGSLVKDECTWSYKLNVQINSLKGTVDEIKVNAKNAIATADYKVVLSSDNTHGTEPDNPPQEEQNFALDSTNKDIVLSYYKKIAEINKDEKFAKAFELKELNGSSYADRIALNVIKPIAENALKEGGTTDDPFPGQPDAITAADWVSAKAVKEGNYTVLTIKVQPQEDGNDGKQFEGPCGRSIGVVGSVNDVLKGVKGLTIESVDAKIKYTNPVITVKVDNATGKIVKGGCSWSYTANIQINSFKGNYITNLDLKNASAVIDYKVTY